MQNVKRLLTVIHSLQLFKSCVLKNENEYYKYKLHYRV